MLLVAVSREAAQTGRAADGRGGELPAGWEKMAARLATPAGKNLYKRRAALVEPAFAQFFGRFGRYLNYRGRDAADAEIKLLGRRPQPRQAPGPPATATRRRHLTSHNPQTSRPPSRPGPARTALQHACEPRPEPAGHASTPSHGPPRTALARPIASRRPTSAISGGNTANCRS